MNFKYNYSYMRMPDKIRWRPAADINDLKSKLGKIVYDDSGKPTAFVRSDDNVKTNLVQVTLSPDALKRLQEWRERQPVLTAEEKEKREADRIASRYELISQMNDKGQLNEEAVRTLAASNAILQSIPVMECKITTSTSVIINALMQNEIDLFSRYVEDELFQRYKSGEEDILSKEIEENPILKDFCTLKSALFKRDENGRSGIETISEFLLIGANALKEMPSATKEERVFQRETAIRMAGEIADKLNFSAEYKEWLIEEITREADADAALDTGMVETVTGKRKDVDFINTRQYSWVDFIRTKLSEADKQEITDVYMPCIGTPSGLVVRPIEWDNLERNTQDLTAILDVIAHNDYGLKQKMYAWANERVNGELIVNFRENFDSMIESPQFNSVKQWQTKLNDYLSQFHC